MVIIFISKGKVFTLPDEIIKPSPALFLRIVFTNFFVISIMIGGVFLFGIPTLCGIISNAIMIGSFVFFILFNYKSGWEIILKRFVPHSLEVAAILVAGSIGIQGLPLVKSEKMHISVLYKNRKAIIIAYTLIIISAFLEYFVSWRICE